MKDVDKYKYECENIKVKICGVPVTGITHIAYDFKHFSAPVIGTMEKLTFESELETLAALKRMGFEIVYGLNHDNSIGYTSPKNIQLSNDTLKNVEHLFYKTSKEIWDIL